MSEEEMKALVEMKDMLKHENEKLKQEKQELIEWLEEEIKSTPTNVTVFGNSFIDRSLAFQEVLERLC